VIKTLGRNLLGVDKAFKQGMIKKLGPIRDGTALLKMDAANLDMADASFDVVFSISVFEHLTDPLAVTKEVERVLRPGGLAIIAIHLYTSDSGIHDPRLFGERDDLPYWAHLRPQHAHLVNANCYLNKMRLSEFKTIFDERWQGVKYEYLNNDDIAGNQLTKLRQDGELDAYSDEELMVNTFSAIWKKPR